MAFKIGTKKILSEQNISKIIMLGIGLRDKLENAEKGLISDYDETTTYTRGQAVYYNNYLYECKYTTTGTFDESKWQKIGDELSLIDKQTLASMINLSDEEIASLQSLISTEIRLDKCFSASDTYNRLLTVENNCKAYTLEQLAKKTGASYKIATSVTDMTSTEYLYLLANANNAYDIYALIDGVVTKIGDTTIDLSQFYTKTEIDNDFLKKADADGKYSTILETNNKIDKSNIVTTISDTATNEQIYSADVMNSELGKKFEKDNILSVIQDTDNSKIFGAKAVYDTFNQKCDKINLYELKDSTNNNKTKHMIIDIPASHSISGKTTRVFFTDNISSIGLQIWNGATLEKDYRTPLISPNHIYKAPKTLTPVNSKVNFTNTDSSCYYTVINGICYVNIWSMNITGDLSVETILSGLPTAKTSAQFILSNDIGSKTVGMGWIGIGTQNIQCNAKLETGTTKSQGYTRFSYPIDESWIPS